MTTTAASKFVRDVAQFHVTVPVEVRIEMAGVNGRVYHLTAYVDDHGVIRHGLSIRGAGQPESLSNLQSKAPFPGKAVSGWQAEVVAFCEAGLGTVIEVR